MADVCNEFTHFCESSGIIGRSDPAGCAAVELPRREYGAASAAVEVCATGGSHAAEELGGKVEPAGFGCCLDRESGNRVVVARRVW
ncbi:hypothetical protein ACJIZ3_006885 [Penstemon smallii]|uniref:Uncharacterized protein n=1 Tax=Penstemon smallii TaxID=265156 RepID=A0ABD3S8Z8_9LAMI